MLRQYSNLLRIAASSGCSESFINALFRTPSPRVIRPTHPEQLSRSLRGEQPQLRTTQEVRDDVNIL
jgi:hypothetical protein